MFGELRKDVGEALSKACKLEGVTIIKAATLPDHVHMYVSLPPQGKCGKESGQDQREECPDNFRQAHQSTRIRTVAISGQGDITAKPLAM